MSGEHHPSSRRRSFDYTLWGFVCFLISFIGFWPSYVTPLVAGTYDTPSPLMPWHVACSALWLLLLMSQPLLVQMNRVALHRQIGLFGALVAIGLVVTGIVVQIHVMGPYAEKGDTLNAVSIPFIRFTLLLLFTVGVGLAIRHVKRPDWHKRLILLGTFPLLQSSFDRLFANVFGMEELRGLMALVGHVLIMIAFAVWDRRQMGKWHPVTKWGTMAITVFVLVTPPLSATPWWQQVAARLAGH